MLVTTVSDFKEFSSGENSEKHVIGKTGLGEHRRDTVRDRSAHDDRVTATKPKLKRETLHL